MNYVVVILFVFPIDLLLIIKMSRVGIDCVVRILRILLVEDMKSLFLHLKRGSGKLLGT